MSTLVIIKITSTIRRWDYIDMLHPKLHNNEENSIIVQNLFQFASTALQIVETETKIVLGNRSKK
jgi:hypothetical protein